MILLTLGGEWSRRKWTTGGRYLQLIGEELRIDDVNQELSRVHLLIGRARIANWDDAERFTGLTEMDLRWLRDGAFECGSPPDSLCERLDVCEESAEDCT